jgi:hypothetical protein
MTIPSTKHHPLTKLSKFSEQKHLSEEERGYLIMNVMYDVLCDPYHFADYCESAPSHQVLSINLAGVGFWKPPPKVAADPCRRAYAMPNFLF